MRRSSSSPQPCWIPSVPAYRINKSRNMTQTFESLLLLASLSPGPRQMLYLRPELQVNNIFLLLRAMAERSLNNLASETLPYSSVAETALEDFNILQQVRSCIAHCRRPDSASTLKVSILQFTAPLVRVDARFFTGLRDFNYCTDTDTCRP